MTLRSVGRVPLTYRSRAAAYDASPRDRPEEAPMEDIEAIRQLKARYFRTMDTKDWGGMRAVFTDDVVIDTSEAGGDIVSGADAFMTYLRGYSMARSRCTTGTCRRSSSRRRRLRRGPGR